MKYESSNFFKIDSVLKSIKPAGWKVQPWSKTGDRLLTCDPIMIVYFTSDPINDVSFYVSNICVFSNASDVYNMQNMFPIQFV